jgi:SAM-dependent methyltransferase
VDLRETPRGDFARHPWEAARASFFRRLVVSALPPGNTPLRVLDVGAGDAWFAGELLPTLPAGSRVTCWDTGYADHSPPAPEGESLEFTAEQPAGPFDLVLMLDVAEHVEDDLAFLGTIARSLLAPAGVLIFSVPAWPLLMSAHDVALHHHRRYTPARARALLAGAGLRIEQSGGLFHSLLAPRAVTALRDRVRPRPVDAAAALEWRGPALLRRAIELALRADNELSWVAARAAVPLPGLSFWAQCRRS